MNKQEIGITYHNGLHVLKLYKTSIGLDGPEVHIANTLYCKLTHPDIDIEDVEEIAREINDKLVIKGTVHQNADENNFNLVPTICIAMLIIAILIFLTLHFLRS